MSTLEKRLVSIVDQAYKDGCPIALRGEEIAKFAIRRWKSSARRLKKINLESQTRDLAKGLISKFEESPELVGPLKQDYLWLSQKIAEVLKVEVNT